MIVSIQVKESVVKHDSSILETSVAYEMYELFAYDDAPLDPGFRNRMYEIIEAHN